MKKKNEMVFSNQDLLRLIHLSLGPDKSCRVHALFYDELRFHIDLFVSQVVSRLRTLALMTGSSQILSNHLLAVLIEVPLSVKKDILTLPREVFNDHFPPLPDLTFSEQSLTLLQQCIERRLSKLISSAYIHMLSSKRKTLECRDLDDYESPIRESHLRWIKTFLNLSEPLAKLAVHPEKVASVNHLITLVAHDLISVMLHFRSLFPKLTASIAIVRSIEFFFPTPEIIHEVCQNTVPTQFSAKYFRKMDNIEKLDEPSLNILLGVLEWVATRGLERDELLKKFHVYF